MANGKVANDEIGNALFGVFTSPNVSDSNYEAANMVDVIDRLGHQIQNAAKWLGNGDASTHMGALEAHGKAVLEGCTAVASAISDLAEAVRQLGRK